MIPPDDERRFFAEYFGMEPDAIPMGMRTMLDEIRDAVAEMNRGVRGYLPAGPEVRGLLEGGDGGVMGLLGWDAPTEQELEVATPERADVPFGLARPAAAGMSMADASHLTEMMRTPAQPREEAQPEPTPEQPVEQEQAQEPAQPKSEWEEREDLDADLEEPFDTDETEGAWLPRESGVAGMENANGEVAYDWKEENGLLVAEEDGETISGGRENFQDEADEALGNITEALPSVEGNVVYLQTGPLEPGKAPTKLVVFGESSQAIAGALDAANVSYRDNFDSIDEKMEEGKETRDGDPYDESHYKVTISGKKNVQAAIQALVGDNGDYGAVVLQDEGGSIRIMLNPKSVDMDGVTTLAQAQAANEQLRQGIEERNRQAIAAWEARTGLKYDPEWREHVLRPDGPFRESTGSYIREGTILNGEWNGEVREYRDGVLRKTAIYKNGSETGTRKLYRGDGTLALDRFFNEDGNAVEIHYGKDGKTEEYRLVLGKRKVLFDSRKQAEEKQEAPAETVAQPAPGAKDSWEGRPIEAIVQDIRSIRATPRKEHTSPLLKAGTFRQEDGSYRTVKSTSNILFTVYQTLDGKRIGEEQEWRRRFNDNKRGKLDDFLTLEGTTRYDDNGNPVEILRYDPDGRIHGRERFRSWFGEDGYWHVASIDHFVVDEDGVYIGREGKTTDVLPLDVLDETRGQAGNMALSVSADGKRYFRDADEVLEDFIKELEGVELNEEQRGIYDVVTRKKKETDIRKRDLRSIIKFRKGSRGKGGKKIITTHYAGLRNPVTAREVIDMGIVIRHGTLVEDGTDAHPTSYHYEYISPVDGAKLTLVVDRGKKGDEEVINYYSNRKVRNRGQEASSGSMTSSSENTIANPGADVKPGNTALSVGGFGLNAEEDAAYLDAVRRGDTEAARRMVEERARKMGVENPIPEQTDAYKVRVSAPPKKTIKVYKVFTIDQAGRPTALFVSGMDALPMGVWLDAQDTWHFTAKNGKQYIPSTANPNGRGGKTGTAVEIPDEATRQELIKRGFLPQGSKAKTVVALAYRPGWHAGDMPFFPQGGVRRAGSNYGNVHHARQVVFECEMDADHDYTDEARRQPKALTKDGRVNEANADLQSMPEGGFYRYSTNPLTKGGKRGTWFISGSLKINRALTQGEADGILRENGFAPQEWEQGELDLAQLGYRGDESEAARKTLAPVTYDDDGKVIPLSQRFNPENPDIRLSVGERMGGRAPVVEPGGDVREAGEGTLAWLRRKFVHSQTPVFDAVRRVMGVGREPPDTLNVEAAAKNVHGKIRARQEMLQRAYLEPLKAILAQPGMDRKRFDDYALALHALERNRMIQERSVVVDPTTGEVVDLGVEAGSGVTNAWAERVIREIQRDPFALQYKEAANILAEMNRFVLRGAVADGLLTEAQAKTWMRLSPHYVPLKSGGAAPGAIHKRATGRFTRPDSVLVNSMRQAYATVRNGELNRVNKTMADWIREYDPNGEQVGGTVPESHKHAKIKMADPQYVPKGSSAEALLRERGIRLVETEDKGGYWVDTGVLPNALKRVVRESVPQGDDIVTFWENGERKFIRFEGKRGRDGTAENEAARIADALNFKNVLHKEGRFWDAIRGLTRWKANVSTSWNPTFIVRNMGADVFNTANLMMIEGKYAELARTMRNYPEALNRVERSSHAWVSFTDGVFPLAEVA